MGTTYSTALLCNLPYPPLLEYSAFSCYLVTQYIYMLGGKKYHNETTGIKVTPFPYSQTNYILMQVTRTQVVTEQTIFSFSWVSKGLLEGSSEKQRWNGRLVPDHRRP